MAGDPQAEDSRLAALNRFDILDTPKEESFDRIVRLVRMALNVPMAHISFLDAHRLWMKAGDGISVTDAPRKQTFCTRVLEEGEPLIIPDATLDERTADSAFVRGEPGVRFYAGFPLRTVDGHIIGTICAIDTKPRAVTPQDTQAMTDFAQLVIDELELRQLASTDALTGCMSRRAFREAASRAVALALRHHEDLSCIIIDIDHFKSVNDRFGHPVGDVVLARSAAAWAAALRTTDLIGRIGGEEFAVLLPHTNSPAAMGVAEKLRATAAAIRVELPTEMIGVTASFGVASLGRAAQDLDTLMQNADKALYQAKKSGRDRSVAYSPPEAEVSKPRRRVLKGGRILFNERASSIDCTVRGLSDDGAAIDVSSSVGVPKVFELAIMSDHFQRSCRTVARTEKHLEVEFC